MSENHLIDAKGLTCPMPVIKVQQQVRKSNSGDILIVECTDLGAEKDISSWAKVNKHQIIECKPFETLFKNQPTPAIRISLRVG